MHAALQYISIDTPSARNVMVIADFINVMHCVYVLRRYE